MRARNIKPGFFVNEDISELDPGCRLLFIGLWCMADRKGFLKYRPKRIWAELFPYDQAFMPKVGPWLALLSEMGFVNFWYENPNYTPVDTENKEPSNSEPLTPVTKTASTANANKIEPLAPVVFIEINNFLKHQSPHKREKESEIEPLCPGSGLYMKSRPERGKRNEERGMRKEEVTVPRSKEPTSKPEPEIIEGPVFVFPLNKKNTEFKVFDEDIAEWQSTFPGIDVLQELRHCRQWSIDNPKRRKTKAGIRTHITAWLGKVQNRSRDNPQRTRNNDPKPRNQRERHNQMTKGFAAEILAEKGITNDTGKYSDVPHGCEDPQGLEHKVQG